jgi:hypothetical protein
MSLAVGEPNRLAHSWAVNRHRCCSSPDHCPCALARLRLLWHADRGLQMAKEGDQRDNTDEGKAQTPLVWRHLLPADVRYVRQMVVGEAGLNPSLNPLLLLDLVFGCKANPLPTPCKKQGQPLAPTPCSSCPEFGRTCLALCAISSPLEKRRASGEPNKTAPQGASILKGAR